MAKKLTRMHAKALGVGARGRSGDDGGPRDVGARKQRGIAKQKIETGCVLVFFCKATGSPISTVHYLWIKSYGQWLTTTLGGID